MKTRTKALLLALCAVVLVVATVFGTMAFLTDTQRVVNTFSVGSVAITLDEAKVNEYGQKLDKDGNVAVDDETLAARVAANTYKLLPGHTYTKDPTVTVVKGSEPSYVRILVTVSNIHQITRAIPEDGNAGFYGTWMEKDVFLLQNMVNGWDSTLWTFAGYSEATVKGVTSATYEFRYHQTVDARNDAQALDALFDEIKVPQTMNNDQIKSMNAVEITIVANAIQADGFANADAAWTAFGVQHAPTSEPTEGDDFDGFGGLF